MPQYRRKPSSPVQAEQFLPDEDAFPVGVFADGARSSTGWVFLAAGGVIQVISPGDWVVDSPDEGRFAMREDVFDALYETDEGIAPPKSKGKKAAEPAPAVLDTPAVPETPAP